jgi:hypothetical protein
MVIVSRWRLMVAAAAVVRMSWIEQKTDWLRTFQVGGWYPKGKITYHDQPGEGYRLCCLGAATADVIVSVLQFEPIQTCNKRYII